MIELPITISNLDRIADALERLAFGPFQDRIKVKSVRLDRWTIIEGDIMAITITDSQKFTITVQPVTKKGNPAPVDGPVVFAASDPALLTVTPIDNVSAEVAATGALGNGQVTFRADKDLGPDVAEIMGVLDVHIIAGAADSFVATTSVPVEQ